MFYYINSLYNYLFPDHSKNEDADKNKEQFLAQEILNLEISEQSAGECESITPTPEIPRDAVCYQRSGVITYLQETYVLIDGMHFFDTTACSLNLHIQDKVLYLCFKNENDAITVVRILENQGISWGNDEDDIDENSFRVLEHVFVGQVDQRQDRAVFIKDSSLKFNLDNVIATFIPVKGDWLELLCKVKFDEDKPSDTSLDLVTEVLSFKPVRSKVNSAIITGWNGETGICDKLIFFDKHCIEHNIQPTIGSKVLVEVIESTQGACTWRVIKMHITESASTIISEKSSSTVEDIQEKSLNEERKRNIEVTFPLVFDKVHFQDNPIINLNITNNSEQEVILNKWILLVKKRDSQVNISPFLTRPRKIFPGHSISLTITCQPKFYGQCKEHLIVMFRGFQVERLIEINVLSSSVASGNLINNGSNTKYDQVDNVQRLKNMRKQDKPIQGVRLKRNCNFISVRLGLFPIPEKVWNAVLGDSHEIIHHDYAKIISRIEMNLPCLIQTLNINNYADKFHTLIYMEEVQATLNMRDYDVPKGFLIRCQEYLGIEVTGLAENRPSLIIGDTVVIKDTWNTNEPSYEGYIHLIKGNLVLIKFHPRFHETYSGSDVSIQFKFSRTSYRKAHQAVNLAISNLGVDVLFPSRIKLRSPQISLEKLEKIEWFNTSLNDGQKAAVTNILKGECRPMPYCIYGPPGTGKTITVVETILQILTHISDSRILVAAPSNSAANLIAERLLMYRKIISNSIVRIIANHLVDSENFPDEIKPYSATINIAIEGTEKSSHVVKNGINLNVHASYIARYRVAIGTCSSLGLLSQLGLPKGHYTHIIVDEAGQAVEPEVMIPLTFLDKENGQIILAGDPMQLGPVVFSTYCREFGYNESYLSRILNTFQYQRDYHAYKNGFNDKLVTRLTDNYRSLKEVIKLPSEMFYDGTLVPKLHPNMPWIEKLLNVVYEIFETTDDNKTGGIFVYGVRGINTRSEDSPSWFNPQEASMVAMITCKLFKKNIIPDDIGIITPYVAQIKYIRLLFDAMGLPRPKIGTVEEFQGQEKPLIIISTVRTSETHLVTDQNHGLGFVKNPKRLNVSLTRAQVATFLFCDPHLLLNDPLWQKVINHACQNDRYMGCDLPFTCSKRSDNLNIK